eukprot:CAMPEP_0119551816 /NCGR_PEP_ID=MMETSP1352-20130426/4957_1 /TAXON_ID=265584 /ORGANISM="Stauroneis constricta, Strain CCMP1120" /LENGTH=844 /DNA_ID=CAMNT_0007597931 /DNA_START=212 /DNA_END=2747 /DNA_ORIENTATION=+
MMSGAFMMCVLLLALPNIANAQPGLNYLPQPESLWDRTVIGAPGKGNAIALSPDGAALYVTTSDGTVSALLPENGRLLGSFRVPPNDRDWDVTCESGMDFYMNTTVPEESYFVFTVVDVPPFGSAASNRKESRVFAMTHSVTPTSASLNTPRWVSPSLAGVALGEPLISTDGQYVYFTRTSVSLETPSPTGMPSENPTRAPTGGPSSSPSAPPTASPSGFPSSMPTVAPTDNVGNRARDLQGGVISEVIGYFTMLSDVLDGQVFFEEPSTLKGNLANHYYGPLTISRTPVKGNYAGGEGNTNDFLVWHSTADPDLQDGATQAFQLPSDFDGLETSGLSVIQLSIPLWVTAAAPAITADGQELFIGSSDSILRGWVDGRSFELSPTLNLQLGTDGTSAPPPHAPVFSTNEQHLFLGTTASSFQAVDVQARDIAWTVVSLPMNVGTRAVPSPDGLRVYFFSGNQLYSVNATDGVKMFANEGGFRIPSAPDQTVVQTNFALNGDGRIVYIAGFRETRVSAFTVALPPDETASPSESPTTSAPTVSSAPSVSLMPSVSMLPSSIPSDVPTRMPSAQPTDQPSPNTNTDTLPPTSAPTELPELRTRNPTSAPISSSSGGGDDGPSTGIIIGAVAGGLVVAAIVAYLIFVFACRGGGGGGGGGRRDSAAAYRQDDDGGYSPSAYAAGGDTGGESSNRRSYQPSGSGGVTEDSTKGEGGPRRSRPPAAAPPQPPAAAGAGSNRNSGVRGEGGSSSQRNPSLQAGMEELQRVGQQEQQDHAEAIHPSKQLDRNDDNSKHRHHHPNSNHNNTTSNNNRSKDMAELPLMGNPQTSRTGQPSNRRPIIMKVAKNK